MTNLLIFLSACLFLGLLLGRVFPWVILLIALPVVAGAAFLLNLGAVPVWAAVLLALAVLQVGYGLGVFLLRLRVARAQRKAGGVAAAREPDKTVI